MIICLAASVINQCTVVCHGSLFVCIFLDLGLDMQDSSGRHEVGAAENVTRLPVNNDEGCHFKARFKINRVHVIALRF